MSLPELEIAPLVPDVYSAWRPLVVEGFRFFIEQLPRRRRELFASHFKKGDAVSCVLRVMHECPTMHKLGQVLARNRALDAELRRGLQQLESLEPRTPWNAIAPVIKRELRPFIDPYAITVEPTPLAEASVAVVVPVTFCDPDTPGQRLEGVLKVLKPGVTDRLTEELDILSRLADYLDNEAARLGLPAISYRETFDTVRQLLENEVRFDLERSNLVAAAERFAGDDHVIVPKVLPFSSASITAMSRVHGVKITEYSGSASERLARTLIERLIAGPILDRSDLAIFHADPHAGNLFITPEGKLALLDWSLKGALSQTVRGSLIRIIIAAGLMDAGTVAGELSLLSSRPIDDELMRRTVNRWIRSAPLIPGPGWLMAMMDDVASLGAVFPADLLLFRKSLHIVQDVVADLCPGLSLDAVLVSSMVTALTSEWPERSTSPPSSRAFGTHLSNLDLMQTAFSMPMAAMRRWSAMMGFPI